ncbi:hypothetical protein ZIOFF_058697 [Zingiber officinale]|uniref:Uncharacterized protein n=1 Tax=Zingiber officinale TaxID=94328 RepID=A0A8J5KAX7_ZINOF|nr:hypothetical protein ZIOFF_058697 [Zingiber officinale]
MTSNVKLPTYYVIVDYELFSRHHGPNQIQEGDFFHVQNIEKEDVAFSYGMIQNHHKEVRQLLMS